MLRLRLLVVCEVVFDRWCCCCSCSCGGGSGGGWFGLKVFLVLLEICFKFRFVLELIWELFFFLGCWVLCICVFDGVGWCVLCYLLMVCILFRECFRSCVVVLCVSLLSVIVRFVLILFWMRGGEIFNFFKVC